MFNSLKSVSKNKVNLKGSWLQLLRSPAKLDVGNLGAPCPLRAVKEVPE